jgi:hypothetical protein
LTKQVREALRRKPDSKAGIETSTPSGDPDGFGRYRSVVFDKVASKYLLDHGDLESDARILEVKNNSGKLTVTFVSDRSADERTPFDLSGDSDPSAAEEEEE